MKKRVVVALCLILVSAAVVWRLRPRDRAPAPQPSASSPARYPWPLAEAKYEPLSQRLPTSRGFTRLPLPSGSWGEWLRGLPMRRPGTPVRTESGAVRVPGAWPQLGAVVDLDLRRNQQCADIIYRLRAEYLWVTGRPQDISFRATDGSTLSWADWKRGVRPISTGKKLIFLKRGAPDASRASFDRYLAAVFNWCGTLSLDRDTVQVQPADLQVGDILVQGGSPGHAVLVVDLARDRSGHAQALFLQGWMPAQSIHIVSPIGRSGWVGLDPHRPLSVPMFGRPFQWSQVQRFGD